MMTIDEKLQHIDNAKAILRDKVFTEGESLAEFSLTREERDAAVAALEIAAGVCQLFRERNG